MPTRYRIQRISLRLQRLPQSPGCRPEIEGATTYLRTKEEGDEPVVIEASPPDNPVTRMVAAGWEPEIIAPGFPGSAGEGEPVGFKKDALFESIWLDYTVPLKCKCIESDKEETLEIALSVRYDHRSVRKPEFAVEKWDAQKKAWQPIQGKVAEDDDSASYSWNITLPCPGCGEGAVCAFAIDIGVSWVVIKD